MTVITKIVDEKINEQEYLEIMVEIAININLLIISDAECVSVWWVERRAVAEVAARDRGNERTDTLRGTGMRARPA